MEFSEHVIKSFTPELTKMPRSIFDRATSQVFYKEVDAEVLMIKM